MAKTWWETIETTGDKLAETVKDVVEAGNVRRVRVRQKDRVIAEFPLTFGVVGLVVAPVVAGIAAITALATDCTIEVEKEDPSA